MPEPAVISGLMFGLMLSSVIVIAGCGVQSDHGGPPPAGDYDATDNGDAVADDDGDDPIDDDDVGGPAYPADDPIDDDDVGGAPSPDADGS